MSIKIGINGFGRIGRTVLRIAKESLNKDLEIVAINSRSPIDTLAHLFKYDSTFGRYNGDVKIENDYLIIDDHKIKILQCHSPKDIPWNDYGVDIVIESTGKFKCKTELMDHVKNGVKNVVITAPGKDEDITVVMGVNEQNLDIQKHKVISNGSCTTNCLAPVAKVLEDNFGIVKGMMTTIHSYTNDQRILDKTHKDLRRSRAAGESIIPTTTGAARAISKVLPELTGKLNGFSLRVPTPTVSIVDLVCELKKSTTVDELNNLFKNYAETSMKGILGYSDEPLVSVDYKGDPRSSIVDGLSTMIMDGNMVKVVSWYDNEWAYSARVIDLVNYIAAKY